MKYLVPLEVYYISEQFGPFPSYSSELRERQTGNVGREEG